MPTADPAAKPPQTGINEIEQKEQPMQYRKKPVVIEAFQFTRKDFGPSDFPEWFKAASRKREVTTIGMDEIDAIAIHTLEGIMRANLGDWIIKGVANEIYPCKPDIFEKTYDPALPVIASAGDFTEEDCKLFEAPGYITYLPPGAEVGRGEPIGVGRPIVEGDPIHPKQRYKRFEEIIAGAINGCSMENGSDTPDFLLAEFMVSMLCALDTLSQKRDAWYGGSHRFLKAELERWAHEAPETIGLQGARIKQLEDQLEAEGEHTAAANANIDRLNSEIERITRRQQGILAEHETKK